MRTLLAPLSWLYALAIRLRHILYDHKLLPSYMVDIPTICVGNLSVGGTGKTPHVEYLIKLLTSHNYRVAVLLRGYKRSTTGFILADATSTAKTIGDEAMLYYANYPNIHVAVCENRVRGVHQLQKRVKDLDVIILDDAFQHRSLRCGLNIVLTAYDNLYIDDHMLPWGTLRDLPYRANRADIIIVTKCPSTIQPIDMRVVDNRLRLSAFQHLHFTEIDYVPIQYVKKPLILCAIANPQYMIEHVKAQFPSAIAMVYPDHHAYTQADVKQIMAQAKNADCVITTEKDLHRLALTSLPQKLQEQNKQLLVQLIVVRFRKDKQLFDKQVLTYIHENRRKK